MVVVSIYLGVKNFIDNKSVLLTKTATTTTTTLSPTLNNPDIQFKNYMDNTPYFQVSDNSPTPIFKITTPCFNKIIIASVNIPSTSCPTGYGNLVGIGATATCSKGGGSYSITNKGIPSKTCPSGLRNDGISCWEDAYWDGCCSRVPWWLGGGCVGCLRGCGCIKQSASESCPSGQSPYLGLCYTTCKDGYSMKFPGVCSENTPFTVTGANLTCNTGQTLKAGFCVSNLPSGYSEKFPGVYVSDNTYSYSVSLGIGIALPKIKFTDSHINCVNNPVCSGVVGLVPKGTFSMDCSVNMTVSEGAFNVYYKAALENCNSSTFSSTPSNTYTIPTFSTDVKFTIQFDYDFTAIAVSLSSLDSDTTISTSIKTIRSYVPISNVRISVGGFNIVCSSQMTNFLTEFCFGQIRNQCSVPQTVDSSSSTPTCIGLTSLSKLSSNQCPWLSDFISSMNVGGVLNSSIALVNSDIDTLNSIINAANSVIKNNTIPNIPKINPSNVCDVFNSIHTSTETHMENGIYFKSSFKGGIGDITNNIINSIKNGMTTNINSLIGTSITNLINTQIPIKKITMYIPQVSTTMSDYGSIAVDDFNNLTSYMSSEVNKALNSISASLNASTFSNVSNFANQNASVILNDVIGWLGTDLENNTGSFGQILTVVFNYCSLNKIKASAHALSRILVNSTKGCQAPIANDILSDVITIATGLGINYPVNKTGLYNQIDLSRTSFFIGTRYGRAVPLYDYLGASAFVQSGFNIPGQINCKSPFTYSYSSSAIGSLVAGQMTLPVNGKIVNSGPVITFNLGSSTLSNSTCAGNIMLSISFSINISILSILVDIPIGSINLCTGVFTNSYTKVTASNPPLTVGFSVNVGNKFANSNFDTTSGFIKGIRDLYKAAVADNSLNVGVGLSIGEIMSLPGTSQTACA